jgi:hypothetical protein
VAKQRPTVIDRATGGPQAVLRPMPQGMDYLALIDNADAADELVEPRPISSFRPLPSAWRAFWRC